MLLHGGDLLTRTSLRLPTLSTTSGKEGKDINNFFSNPLFCLQNRGCTSAAKSG
jgi:hypothetical protein